MRHIYALLTGMTVSIIVTSILFTPVTDTFSVWERAGVMVLIIGTTWLAFAGIKVAVEAAIKDAAITQEQNE